MSEPPADSDSAPIEPHADTDNPIAVLRRWEDFGGTWMVLERHEDAVTVSLLRCDGGEETHRLTSSDPQVLDWIDRADSA